MAWQESKAALLSWASDVKEAGWRPGRRPESNDDGKASGLRILHLDDD